VVLLVALGWSEFFINVRMWRLLWTWANALFKKIMTNCPKIEEKKKEKDLPTQLLVLGASND